MKELKGDNGFPFVVCFHAHPFFEPPATWDCIAVSSRPRRLSRTPALAYLDQRRSLEFEIRACLTLSLQSCLFLTS